MKRAGDLFNEIFDKGLMEKAKSYTSLLSCWKDLTEKNGIAAAAAHSWIKSLDKGLVWLEVDHPGWKQILQTKESKLLSDFRYRFKDMDISGISIVLYNPQSLCPDDKNIVPEKENALDDSIAVSSTGTQAQYSGYDDIKDGALKEVLMRLEKSIAGKENSNKTTPF